ncbi:DUF3828 domain-containing protein [Yersinia hibernica]|uniref:DUF3828 domain-containing protein n=1 Tax=Yersinia hibernica TaxID=2339259 RepID=A0ABX5R4R0_9GAMM|nr:DUF3828 domain-containing protein [Yersinia hibernica]
MATCHAKEHFVRIRHQIDIFLSVMLLSLSVSFAHAAKTTCLPPEDTVTSFYRWYLNEISADNYPLTSKKHEDKENMAKWVSPSLLKNLQYEISNNELDAEYFTDAQDIFDEWVEHINSHKVTQTNREARVELTLGVNDSKRKYEVIVDNNATCWKINRVQSVQ